MVNLAFIDGGGIASPQNHPQTHTVAAGEKLSDIADRYGVTPQAIREANPDIFQDPSARRRDNAENGGELIWSGGVGSVEDMRTLRDLRLVNLTGVISGKALYENRFTVQEAQAELDARPG